MSDQPAPTALDPANAAMRAIAEKQNARYAEASTLALAALGPGFTPRMRLALIDAGHRRTGDRTPAAVAYEAYRGEERASENARFIRRLPGGRTLKGDTPGSVFGDPLTQRHESPTIGVKGGQLVGRGVRPRAAHERGVAAPQDIDLLGVSASISHSRLRCRWIRGAVRCP
jgi:hypothetical protein